jgi:toxin ParE1/3/4
MAIYRLALSAQADIARLLSYTEEHFGQIARLRYERLLVTALRDIAAAPERSGSLARSELGENVHSYHLKHSRERARSDVGIVARPRHLLLYRFARSDLIGIGRVLHDSMEIKRQIPEDYGDT